MRTIVAVSFCIGLAASAALAASEPVRDRFGRTIAFFQTDSSGRITVTDCYGAILGWATANGTFDRFGARILGTPVPGILVHRSACSRETPAPATQ